MLDLLAEGSWGLREEERYGWREEVRKEDCDFGELILYVVAFKRIERGIDQIGKSHK